MLLAAPPYACGEVCVEWEYYWKHLATMSWLLHRLAEVARRLSECQTNVRISTNYFYCSDDEVFV